MSFFEPLIGLADSFLPGDFSAFSPNALPAFNPNIPRAETAFTNKYQTLSPVLSRIPTPIRNSLINFDLQRISRGQTPLPLADTAKAIQAARTRQAATLAPEPDPGNFFGNAVRNVKELAATVPRVPFALAEEAKDIVTEGPGDVARALSAGNPAEVIQQLANVPGIRMVPGSYVVGNVARGGEGIKELVSNPVFTALDVLPGAQKAAAATPVSRAQQAYRAQMLEAGRFTPELRPIRTVLTRRLDETGNIVPNLPGRIGAQVLSTRPGQVLLEAVGQQARFGSRLEGQANVEYKQQISPEGLDTTDPLVRAIRDAQSLGERYGVDDRRAAELWTQAQLQDPYRIPDITDSELAYLKEAREEILPRITQETLNAGDNVLYRGEVYDATTGTRLRGLESRFHSLQGRINNTVLPRLYDTFTKGQDARIGNLIAQLEAGDYAGANRTANGLWRGKTRLDRPQAVLRGRGVPVRAMAPADASLAAIGNVRRVIRDVLAAEKRLERGIASSPPARFQPLIGKRAAEKYVRESPQLQMVDADTAAQMAEAILRRDLIDVPGWDAKLFRDTVGDISRSWQAMRDTEGLDPMFVHRVTPGRAEAARYAGVSETIPTISQAKQRVADISPSVQDIGVALSHQGMELLARRASEDFIHSVIQSTGVDSATLAQQYAPAARARALADPRMDYASHLKNMINRDYTRYDPSSFINWTTDRFNDLDLDNLYLPKTIANNLLRSHNPKTYRLSAVMDPITNAFRTSLLPLSPRWHVYNILGGAMMTAVQTGPRAFRYANEARGLLKALREGDQATIQARLPRELVLSLGSQVREAAELRYRAGNTLSRIFEEAGTTSPVAKRMKERAQQLSGGLKKVTDRSFEVNQLFDDMYRVMTYLNEYDKGIRKGVMSHEAQRTAIEGARRIVQQWDEYTPIERQVLRHILPFYGFTQHIMRFAFKYPFDHPVRAAILGGIARKEIEDLGTGLPTAFLNSFFFGDMDENGHQKAVSLRGLNPFNDVGNMLTLTGFAAATNPMLSTVLEQLGLENGEMELYPNLRLDPTTGRLVAQQESPLLNFLHNTIPQSQVLTGLLGVSTEFKDLLSTNPAAAQRALISQAGLPILFRDYDLPAEYMKAEVKRLEEQNTARREAFKSGNYSYAERFPGLSGLADQVRQLQSSGALDQFQPTIGDNVQAPVANAYQSQLQALGQ